MIGSIRYLEELRRSPVGAATVRQLLTHSSGLPGWRPYYERIAATMRLVPGFLGSPAARDVMLGYIARRTCSMNGARAASIAILGFMLLGFTVERLSGESLEQFCRRRIYDPLEAHPLTYAPRGPLALAC